MCSGSHGYSGPGGLGGWQGEAQALLRDRHPGLVEGRTQAATLGTEGELRAKGGRGRQERVCPGQRRSRFAGWKNICFTVQRGGGTERADPLRAVAETQREEGSRVETDRLPMINFPEGWLPAPS